MDTKTLRSKIMKKIDLLYFSLVFLLAPGLCLADGGLPILLMLNGYVFTTGFVLVLIIEFFYLKRIFKQAPYKKIVLWTFLINIATAIIGVIVVPFVFIFTGTDPLFYMIAYDQSWIDPLFILGPILLDFLITYIITVFVEYWILRKFFLSGSQMTPKTLLKHSFLFNLFSYVAMVVLFFGTQMHTVLIFFEFYF